MTDAWRATGLISPSTLTTGGTPRTRVSGCCAAVATRAAERGSQPADPLRAEIQALDTSVRDIPFEWHRFNLTEAEGRCTTALAVLERAHRMLNAERAAGKTAALEDPSSARPPSFGRELNRPLRPGEKPLRFAVADMLGPVATYDAYVGLLGDLARSLDRPYQLVQRRTYQEINELLLRGDLDLAFVCSGAYAALPAGAPVEIVAVPVAAGRSVYHSLIVVPASSSARRFEDLKGARFAFTDPLSNTGYLYPVYRLATLGTSPAGFFSSTLFSGSHDRSILAMYRKLVDAAAVDDLVFVRIVVPGSPVLEPASGDRYLAGLAHSSGGCPDQCPGGRPSALWIRWGRS